MRTLVHLSCRFSSSLVQYHFSHLLEPTPVSQRNVRKCKIPKEQIAKARKVRRPGENDSFHLFTYFPQQSLSSAPKLLKIWLVRVTHLSTRVTERKIQSRSDFYPVAPTQIFSFYLCCWFCSALHAVLEMSDWFPLYDGLPWAGVCLVLWWHRL